MEIQIPTRLPFSNYEIRSGPSRSEICAATEVINRTLLRLHQLLYAGLVNMPTHPTWMVRMYSPQGQVGISGLLEAIGPDEHGKEISIKGKTPEEVYRLVYLFEEVKRSRRIRHDGACCILAEPRYCICIKSFTCVIHGIQYQGSHD